MKYMIWITTLLFSLSAHAIDLGKPIESASSAYLKDGVEAFIPALMKDSPLEGEKSLVTQSNNIRQIEAYYGKFLTRMSFAA